ncbi:LOW QUALITY PROTEIN: hypothetical protein PanWU01x14_176120 [Parasponia andersonii]|uniref:Uncharacterized protein n=1 Tax=Parasponia andersonii TaxID=3476 RepID=A0A2P5C823_PARAD|nr:LOW QUALITY PROTEIN: hypothetical protein PanWU01x14_176120 [Parasponia andersonii]
MFQKIYNNSNNNKLPSPIFIDLKKSRVDPNSFEFEPLITVRFLSSFNVLIKYHIVIPLLGLRLHVRNASGNRSALGQVLLLQPLLQPRLLLAPKRHRLALGHLLRVRDLNHAAELRPQLLDREHQQPILAVEEVERPAAIDGALHGVKARHAVVASHGSRPGRRLPPVRESSRTSLRFGLWIGAGGSRRRIGTTGSGPARTRSRPLMLKKTISSACRRFGT